MAVAAEVETEIKYEVGAEPPALADLPGVAEVTGPGTVRLSAVYYDTADLRLARHGATLRRRTGGSDEGWHLKVPLAGDSRVELRLPLENWPTNAPPEELADLTFGMARGVAIRPVAQIRTTRRTWRLLGPDGAFVAEVAQDRVVARRLGDPATEEKWRELEVEFADPAAVAPVDKALRAAGLRRAGHSSKLARVLPTNRPRHTGTTAGAAVLAYVQARYDELVAQDLRVRRDEPDSVHRMRVATRRLRSALRVYQRLVPDTEQLRAELRWLGRRLAEARDLEVQHARFTAAVAALPEELVAGPVLARLTRHFGPAEEEARRSVTATLRDRRYRHILDELDRLLAEPVLTAKAARPAARELPRHVRRAYRRTRRRVAADPPHQVRKAAKRYRYALEVAEPAVGKPARKARKAVRALTKVLGAHQDAVVALPVLRELGMQAHLAAENGFTFGLLLADERTRAARVEVEWPRYWQRVRKTRL